ncbi:Peptide/nickel transport system substrate-binding protein [Hyphomicrobiales bacterium]|nr:Peptide/nickel transport system substrate-binding protein [Hyphomicrobiales bacterium]CAH1693681.1 Peptide/nickel transport system substrate-binding protein [Hyphomicrobiales bacterium]
MPQGLIVPPNRSAVKTVLTLGRAALVFLFLGSAGWAQSQGGRVTWALINEDATLNPINSTATGPAIIGPKIFEGLVRYDEKLDPQPELATQWSVSEDGLTYTFTLRPNVKWHDGQPFTAEDVKFSLERLKAAHPRGRVTFSSVSAIETPDPQTVVVKLSRPAPFLLTALAASESPIVPAHIYKDVDASAPAPDRAIIGTGPFIFKEWKRGNSVLLARNPNYWDQGKPYLDEILFRFVPDAAARAAAFEAKEIDIGGDGVIAAAEIARIKQVPHLLIDEKRSTYEGTHRMLIFNFDTPVLQDRKVRQALSHAIDRKAVNNLIWFGQAVDSPTPISPSLAKFHNPNIKGYAFDPALANKLLDEAGYPKKNDGYRFKLRISANNSIDPRISFLFQQQLKAVGVDSEIQRGDRAAYLKRIYTDRDFDLTTEALANAFDPTIGVQRVYWSKAFKVGVPFANPGHYSNPEVDTLLEAAAVELNADKRRELFLKFQEVVHNDAASVDLVDPPSATVVNRRVKNYFVGGNGLSHNFASTYIDK